MEARAPEHRMARSRAGGGQFRDERPRGDPARNTEHPRIRPSAPRAARLSAPRTLCTTCRYSAHTPDSGQATYHIPPTASDINQPHSARARGGQPRAMSMWRLSLTHRNRPLLAYMPSVPACIAWPPRCHAPCPVPHAVLCVYFSCSRAALRSSGLLRLTAARALSGSHCPGCPGCSGCPGCPGCRGHAHSRSAARVRHTRRPVRCGQKEVKRRPATLKRPATSPQPPRATVARA